MLKHPWLTMPANYKTKYSDQEFEINKMRKERKYGPDYVTADLLLDDPKEEMNLLIDSEPEMYEADSDDQDSRSNSPGKYNDDIIDSDSNYNRERRMERAFETNCEGEERSLEKSHEGRARLQ